MMRALAFLAGVCLAAAQALVSPIPSTRSLISCRSLRAAPGPDHYRMIRRSAVSAARLADERPGLRHNRLAGRADRGWRASESPEMRL